MTEKVDRPKINTLSGDTEEPTEDYHWKEGGHTFVFTVSPESPWVSLTSTKETLAPKHCWMGQTWGSEWVHSVFETHRGQNYKSHGYTFHLSTCIPGIRMGRQWDGGMDECQKVILGTCVAGLTAVPMVLPFNTVQCHGHWLYVDIWD